jgi:hypothetical protein
MQNEMRQSTYKAWWMPALKVSQLVSDDVNWESLNIYKGCTGRQNPISFALTKYLKNLDRCILHDEVHQLLHSKTRDTENKANYHFQQLSIPRDTHTRVLQIYAWLQVFLQVFFWLNQSQKLTLLIWTITFHNFSPSAHSSWCAHSTYINSFIIHSY